VEKSDPAFAHPTKPVGPIYTTEEAQRIGTERGWSMAPDGTGARRVVASPRPVRVLALEPIRWLLAHNAVVIAAGGGGIPVVQRADDSGFEGVEAVIDKDLCSSLLARELAADCLVIVTDVDAVYLDWGLPTQRALGRVTPQFLQQHTFVAGSMAPKVEAACAFVLATGKRAVIGPLNQIEALLAGEAGTQVSLA
jgi:carbamate kinase